MNNSRNLLKSVTSLGIVQIANYVFPFVTIPIVSRILGPDKIGLVNYGASFALYFVLIVAYSFELTGVRRAVYISEDNLKLNKLFSEIFCSQLLLFFIAVLLFIPCLFFIPFLQENYYVSIISFAFCLQSLFSQNWLFQVKHELKFIAIYNFLARSLIMIGVLLFIRKKEDYILYAIIFNLVPVLISIILFTITYKKFKLKLTLPRFRDIKNLIIEDRFVFFSNMIISLYSTTNTVILGFYHSNEVVGYYTSANKIVDIARNVVMRPLVQGLFPFVGAAFAKGYEYGVDVVRKLLPLFFVLTLCVVLSLFLIGPLFIELFFGNKFKGSIVLIQILSFSLFGIFFNMFFGSIIMLNLKMDNFFFKISIFAAVFSLIMNFIFVPHFGAIASCVIWTLTEFLIISIQAYIINKKNVNIFTKDMFSFSYFIKSIKDLKS